MLGWLMLFYISTLGPLLNQWPHEWVYTRAIVYSQTTIRKTTLFIPNITRKMRVIRH